MSFKLLDKATAIGASNSVKLARGITDHTVDIFLESLAATKISAATVVLQGSSTNADADTGVITTSALAIGSTAEKFSNSLFYYRINKTNYSKAVNAAGSTFSAAHVISASKWGAINIYINAAGDWVTRVPLATQAYDTAAEAHDAADLIELTSDLCYVGRILINNNTGDWTANTDDLTDASDITTATFLSQTSSFYDLSTYALAAGDITAQRAMFHVTDKHVDYARVFLSALTGTGEITVRYTPNEIR